MMFIQFRLLGFCSRITHLCFVSLASESPDTPVASADVLRIEVVEVPAKTAETVLAWLEQDIHLIANGASYPFNIALHVVVSVSCGNNGHLSVQ